jgi:DNA-binding response OmpR family regulator
VSVDSNDTGRLSPVHVLIVDDNPEILEMLTELLEISGYRVTCCSRGLSALLTIGRVRPDLVVLDIKLDDISGFDVYRALRAEAEFVDLPILFVSGVFLDEEMIRGRLGDPTARLLLKPIPGERLVLEIEQAMAGRRRAA